MLLLKYITFNQTHGSRYVSNTAAWVTGIFSTIAALITLLGTLLTVVATVSSAIFGALKAPAGSTLPQSFNIGVQYVVRNLGEQLIPSGMSTIPSNNNYSGCSSSDDRLVIRGVTSSFSAPNYNLTLSLGNISRNALYIGGNGSSNIATSNGKAGSSGGFGYTNFSNADQLVANGMTLSPDATTTVTQLFSYVGDAKADRISVTLPVQIAQSDGKEASRRSATLSCGNIPIDTR